MRIVFFALLIFLSGLVHSQKIIQVIDNSTYKPLSNISVFNADKSKLIGVTNDIGKIEIDFKETGYFFSHPDYNTIFFSIIEIEKFSYKVFIHQNVNTYDEIVVSASKFQEKKNDVAQKIQVVRAADIAFQNQSSTADVLANTGNVMVQKSQLGGGSPIIRGFETNKVLLVVDGVRMNNAIYRGGHLQNILTLDNAIMERVEVVFGAGSVVYGSDALGGVMNFTSRSPILSSNNSVLIKSSAFSRYFSVANGYSAHADISLGSKRFGSLSSFTFSKYGDLRQGASRSPFLSNFGARPWYVERINGLDSVVINADKNLQVGSGYSQYDLLQKFTFKQNKSITHKLNFQFSNSGVIPRYDRLTLVDATGPKFSTWNYGPQKRLLATYSVHFENKSKFYDQALIVLGYQAIEESRITRKYRDEWENHQIEKLDIFTVNSDFTKKIGKHEIRYGVEAYFNKVNSSAYSKSIEFDTIKTYETRYPGAGSSMKSFAIYTSHAWEISKKLIINEGIRFSSIALNANFSDNTFFPFPFYTINQNNSAFNGNLGIIFIPTKKWRFTSNLSSGFRAPNVDDLSKVFESIPGSVIVPNPNLRVEYTLNYEFGISREILEGVTLNLTSYYTKLLNAITIQNSKFNGLDSIFYNDILCQVKSSINAQNAYLYGFEGAISGEINKSLSILLTLNYTKGRVLTDSIPYPLDHIPPIFGKFSLISSVNRLRTEFFANYSAWKRIEDYNMIGEDNFDFATPQGMPAWFTLNTRVNYSFSKDLSFQLACENILDQNYRQYASTISAPGRNFILTLRGNF